MPSLYRPVAALLLVASVSVALAQDHPSQDHPSQDHAGQDHAGQDHASRGGDRPNGQQQQSVPYPNITGQENGPGVLSLLPADAVTEHSIALPSGTLAYTATAGTFQLFDTSGQRSAAIFYTAFVAKTDNPASRPATFVFNGGPGAASAFLDLGLVGPRIAEFGMDGRDGSNVKLIDNPDTWLAFTDLVLIDPIGTGWSRAAKPDGAKAFWGVDEDAQSMAKVIALYIAKYSRAASPKFILGESYGGFRAAKVARILQSDQGVVAAGVLMLSPLLEGAFQFGGDRFPLGAALQLPSLAAAKLERDGKFSTNALAQAEHFAMNEYLTTLAGPPLQGEAARAFYARVAALTGVSADALAQTRGFIRDDYIKNLYPGSHKIVSRYDATFASDDPYPETPVARGPDPILDGVIRGYGGAFVGYARDELGFKTDMTYTLLASDINGRWDWGGSGRSPPSVADDLRVLLALSPSFRLLVAHGYSDMVTPYSDSRYVLQHLPQVEGQESQESQGSRERAELKLYRGGHMFYLDPASRKAFTADAKAVYASP